MSLPEDTGVVKVGESHLHYLAEALAGDEFSERILGRLDASVKSVLTTIPESKCKDVDFHFGKLIPRREDVLLDWVWDFLALGDNSCVLFFNACAEKGDSVASRYANVFYYHDRLLNADKIVHVVHKGTLKAQIMQTLKDADTSNVLVGVAISGVRFKMSYLYNDISVGQLFELLDFATYLILGVCDGEAWCFWPMNKHTYVSRVTAEA